MQSINSVSRNHLHLRSKKVEQHDSVIFIPETYQERHSSSEFIILKGSHESASPGSTVYLRKNAAAVTWLDDEKTECIANVRDCLGYGEQVKGGEHDGAEYFVPFGENFLITRDNQTTISAGGLILPDEITERKQSKVGWVEEIGRAVGETAVKIGDRVLMRWDKRIRELGMGGGTDDYFIIVPADCILAIVAESAYIETEEAI